MIWDLYINSAAPDGAKTPGDVTTFGASDLFRGRRTRREAGGGSESGDIARILGIFPGDHPRRQDGLLFGRVNADLINGAAADAAASAAGRLAADGAERQFDAGTTGTRRLLDEILKEFRR